MQTKFKLFAIFGDPVSHSISPLMHNYALKGLGIKGCYTRYRLTQPDNLKEKFLELKLNGVNVTVPHKEAAYLACDEVKGIAKEIKAVNTVINKNGKLIGYNTDAPGFFKSASSFGRVSNVLILGAGGTTKAIAAIYKENKIKTTILNRSKTRLEFFKKQGYETYTWDEFEPGFYDLVVNATSAGLSDRKLPAPKKLLESVFSRSRYAIDVIYNKNTPFLKMAAKYNLKTKDGSQMLLYQGVYAFDLFFNMEYSEKQILHFMKKAF